MFKATFRERITKEKLIHTLDNIFRDSPCEERESYPRVVYRFDSAGGYQPFDIKYFAEVLVGFVALNSTK